MRELALVASGFAMGWAFEAVMRPAWSDVQRGYRLVRRWYRERRDDQAFQPSERAAPAPPNRADPQPPPRRIAAQKPAGGSHRPKQKQARFMGRTHRSRRKAG